MHSKKYKILVVNDDSIKSQGLINLAKAFYPYASEMIVLAPETQQSATGRRLTLRHPLVLKEHKNLLEGVKCYSLSGTPTDCVKFAIEGMKFDFDIVVSGVNMGYNLSDYILYSGTCSAALEAEFYHKKGFAVSTDILNYENIEPLPKIAEYCINNLLEDEVPVYNVNYPPTIKEYKFVRTHQGERQVCGSYEKVFADSYKLVNNFYGDIAYMERNNDELSDYRIVNEGYISVTPLGNDLTWKK